MRRILEAKNLSKSYFDRKQELAVLKNLNLTVDKGEMVFITGRSGSGKSTLLHLLGALDRPTEGEVYLDEVNIYRLRSKERARIRNKKIGFVFQFYYLLPEFSAWENVMLPALVSQTGVPRKKIDVLREKAVGLLEEVGLGARINHLPSELSGGEEQRVAIARALINEPEIVFADEPTGNLDAENNRTVMELIRKLNQDKGQTFIIATHQKELSEAGERLLEIVNGKIKGE